MQYPQILSYFTSQTYEMNPSIQGVDLASFSNMGKVNVAL